MCVHSYVILKQCSHIRSIINNYGSIITLHYVAMLCNFTVAKQKHKLEEDSSNTESDNDGM